MVEAGLDGWVGCFWFVLIGCWLVFGCFLFFLVASWLLLGCLSAGVGGSGTPAPKATLASCLFAGGWLVFCCLLGGVLLVISGHWLAICSLFLVICWLLAGRDRGYKSLCSCGGVVVNGYFMVVCG